MKILAIIVIVSFLSYCSNKKNPDGATKLIIDKSLPESDFERFDYYSGESVIKTYQDSTLVQIDSSNDRIPMNADIYDSVRESRYNYSTCKAFFRENKLIVDFINPGPLLYDSRLRLEINDDYYNSYFMIGPKLESYLGKPRYVKFKKKAKKVGQEIMGELAIDFIVHDTTTLHFKGRFKCVIEKSIFK